MQIPLQKFETPIVIGEPAVSSRITDHQHPPICLGIFTEEDPQATADTDDHSGHIGGCNSNLTPTDTMAT